MLSKNSILTKSIQKKEKDFTNNLRQIRKLTLENSEFKREFEYLENFNKKINKTCSSMKKEIIQLDNQNSLLKNKFLQKLWEEKETFQNTEFF